MSTARRDPLRVGAAIHRLEPLAPDWLVTVVKPRAAGTPWPVMIRYALAIGGALLGGVLAGQIALGGLLANGALTASFGDQGGSIPTRLRRIGAGLVAALIGLLLSRVLLEAGGAPTVVLLAAIGVVSAYLSAVSAVASFAGLQLIVATAVGQGIGTTVTPPVLLGGFLVGAAWSTLLSIASALIQPDRSGPRQSVLTVFDRLDALLEALGGDGNRRAAREALAGALADAWDDVTAARAVSQGRRSDLHRISALIGPLADVASAAADEARQGSGIREHVDAARAVLLREHGAAFSTVPVTGERTAAAVQRLERVIGAPAKAADDRPRRRAGAGVLARLRGRRTALFAVRLSLCLAVSEVLRLTLHLPHSYWLLLTVAVVLKPDLGSVFARGLQRTLGTVVGAGLGIVILLVVPAGPLLLIPVAVLAFGFPFAAARNYGMLATFITPLVLILVDLAGGPTRGLATDRLLDTALGAAVVLLVGYLPWPSTWRPRLGDAMAEAVEAMSRYAATVLSTQRSGVGPVRRRAFGALQDVRSDLQAAFAEPPPRSTVAAAWWPVLGQLEQIGDDLRSVRLVGASVGDEPDRSADAVAAADALRETAAAMRERRAPRARPLPSDGPLRDTAEDIAALNRMLEGPVDGRHRDRARRRWRLGRR